MPENALFPAPPRPFLPGFRTAGGLFISGRAAANGLNRRRAEKASMRVARILHYVTY